MKKTLKTLTTFLLLLSLFINTQLPVDTESEVGISICGDDNEGEKDINVIRKE